MESNCSSQARADGPGQDPAAAPPDTFRAIFDVMNEGVVLFDASGRIDLCNAAFERMSGALPGTLAGSGIVPLLGPRGGTARGDAQRFLAQLAAHPESVERTFWRPDGTAFTVRIAVHPLTLGNDAARWLAVIEDVSERNELERAVLEIATRERNRLGSDLHDGLGQELTGIALMLRSLATRVNRGEGPRAGEIEDLLAMVNATIESARALAHGLAPVALTHDGLVSALVTMIERLRKSSGIDIRFESNCRGPLTLTDPVAQHLYRIAQEALTNALRHASPTRVIVRIKSDGRVVELSVRDDGTGLPEHAHPFSGMGLKIMRYRARLIGGEIALRRRASGGTRVSCTVRLSSPAEPVPASLSAAPTHPG